MSERGPLSEEETRAYWVGFYVGLRHVGERVEFSEEAERWLEAEQRLLEERLTPELLEAWPELELRRRGA